jgi:adenylylsulfate kinase
MILLFCGLSGSGKTTLAQGIKDKLTQAEMPIEIIDADEYRQKLFKDLGYSKEDRFENIRRLGFIASRFSSHNIITVISAINPYDAIRKELATTYENVKVVHIDCDIDVLIERDTKGLYKRALLPAGHPDKLSNLTGINDPFEPPETPDLYINTCLLTIRESVDKIYAFIISNTVTGKNVLSSYLHTPGSR